jgi:hypothetical protein
MSARRTRRTAPPDRITVVKDLVRFGLGAAMIAWQGFVVPPQDFNPWILAAGGVLAGVPGWLQLWSLRNASTDGPSLRPAEQESSSP